MLLETYSAFTKRCLLFLVQKQNSALVLAAACGKKLRRRAFSAHKYKLILKVGCQTVPLPIFYVFVQNLGTKYLFFPLVPLAQAVDRKGLLATRDVAAHWGRVE